jgi:hypothetical protein
MQLAAYCRTVHLAARKSWTLKILDFDEKSTFDFFWLLIGTLVYSEPARFICPFEAIFFYKDRARAARFMHYFTSSQVYNIYNCVPQCPAVVGLVVVPWH